MIKLTATFTGESNSLGYIKGEVYVLHLNKRQAMYITRKDGTGHCPYESLSAFFNNWDNIKHVA